MFIVAYDIHGVILYHAQPQRQTVNAAYCCNFLENHVRPAFRRKRRHLLAMNPIILHDNARSHTGNAVTDLLRRWRWAILEHPTYSPDVSPCDYVLFPKMKEPLRRKRCNTRDAIIRAMGRSLQDINRDGPADGVRRLPQVWQKVVGMGGDYIEEL
jgi:transposase